MVFIVHGAMSLVNDQTKTVAEGVVRVCVLCTRMINKNFINMTISKTSLQYLCFRQDVVS